MNVTPLVKYVLVNANSINKILWLHQYIIT